jgi:hypothetical protein
VIKDSFLESVNALYENTEETCNPVFRMIESVDATVVTNKTRRMMLQRTVRRVQEDEDLTTGPTNSLAPSSAPRLDSTSFPTASPSFAGLDQSESFSVLLYVSGVCNGCLSDLTLSNQVAVPRPAKPEEQMPSPHRSSQSNGSSASRPSQHKVESNRAENKVVVGPPPETKPSAMPTLVEENHMPTAKSNIKIMVVFFKNVLNIWKQW